MDIDNIKLFVFLLMLVVATYIDVNNKIIPNKLNMAALIIGFVLWIIEGSNIYYIISFGIAFIVLMAIAFITDGGIGGGDIKLMSTLGLYVGILDWMIMVLIALLSALAIVITRIIISRKNLKEGIAFAPYILIGYVSTLFINRFGLGGLI